MVDVSLSEKVNRSSEHVMLTEEELRGKKGYLWFRRFQDIVLSGVAVVVLAIPMLLIAAAIYIDDPHGNPIFVQKRIGENGKPFRFFKFRTMIADAESKLGDLLDQNEMDGPVFKMKDDPRITRLGRFLRKVSLDELPQFFNVLNGTMTLVGPRPSLPREAKQYDDYQRQRLAVRPGITCYWQIQPRRNDLSFDEWVELDLKYIRERSFFTDWKILLSTLSAVLHGEGE